ncbi:MAG TPA: hypothetical protein VJN92_09275 [Candidatus Acidoferrum sp.]|nr:hypothetical protein [Candidatus Acidoferrum sp.]
MAFLISLLASSSAFSADGFHELKRVNVPREALAENCGDLEGHPCWEEFLKNGKAFAVDVNDDEEDELLIHIWFQDTGSGGEGYALIQKQCPHWKEIDNGSCLLYWGLRLRKLDRVRLGYHDLRLGYSYFVKWHGTKYVPFESADFRALSASLFGPKDPQDAEIHWLTRHAGIQRVTFEPQWVSRPKDLRYGPIGPVKDASQRLDWFSVYKGGVWAVRGKLAFLLLPRAAYLGVNNLQMDGEWLVMYGDPWCDECASHTELARYHPRSHQLIVARESQIPFIDR